MTKLDTSLLCRQAAEPAPEIRARRKIRFKKDSVANQNDAVHRAQVDQIKARFRYHCARRVEYIRGALHWCRLVDGASPDSLSLCCVCRAAKDSGALPVLMRLEAYLHANKLRSRDIFTKAGFDTR